ncbi:MAG: type IV secretion protein IcmL [Gammaproteobacteria bacterium RIFCSPHIGHO2_02_FULL_39_13]|nr:MAG: type IV secretion protein IcmL [Gammaproteobacteria bacterium RIFCSPHIGHO2_02_FULL_39_13]
MAEENQNKIQEQGSNKSGLTMVLLRNAFYRDNYRRATLALIMLVFINIVLATAVSYRYFNPPQPQYFAANSQYQLIKFHPLSDPVVNNNYVLQWVSDAVQQAFGLDFIHWRQQLQQASNNFTPSGWYWFLQAFKKSGDLDTLVKLSMVSDAQITGAPVIQYQSVLDGVYVWKIQIPVMITYTNVNKTIHQPLSVTVIVERVPVQDNPNQIAINQFLPTATAGE